MQALVQRLKTLAQNTVKSFASTGIGLLAIVTGVILLKFTPVNFSPTLILGGLSILLVSDVFRQIIIESNIQNLGHSGVTGSHEIFSLKNRQLRNNVTMILGLAGIVIGIALEFFDLGAVSPWFMTAACAFLYMSIRGRNAVLMGYEAESNGFDLSALPAVFSEPPDENDEDDEDDEEPPVIGRATAGATSGVPQAAIPVPTTPPAGGPYFGSDEYPHGHQPPQTAHPGAWPGGHPGNWPAGYQSGGYPMVPGPYPPGYAHPQAGYPGYPNPAYPVPGPYGVQHGGFGATPPHPGMPYQGQPAHWSGPNHPGMVPPMTSTPPAPMPDPDDDSGEGPPRRRRFRRN